MHFMVLIPNPKASLRSIPSGDAADLLGSRRVFLSLPASAAGFRGGRLGFQSGRVAGAVLSALPGGGGGGEKFFMLLSTYYVPRTMLHF